MSDVVPEELCYEILLRVPLVPLLRFRSVCKAWCRIIDDLEICQVILILLRVPARSLFRFRSVCKTWCHVIDDSRFVRMHLYLQEDGDNLIVKQDHMLELLPLSSIYHSSEYVHRNAKLLLGPSVPKMLEFSCPVPSYGGLMLIAHHERTVWKIWNPFSNESIEVPPHSYPPTGIVRDNYVQYHSCCVGIGYNSATNDINVVRIFQLRGPGDRCVTLQTLVYSLKLNNWKTIPNFRRPVYSAAGVFVNGALHWIIWKGTASKCILSFDLSTGKERVFPCPTLVLMVNFGGLELHVLGGCLCLKDARAIWIMKDYKQKLWIELVSHDQPSCMGRPLAYIKRKKQLVFEHSRLELLLFASPLA